MKTQNPQTTIIPIENNPKLTNNKTSSTVNPETLVTLH